MSCGTRGLPGFLRRSRMRDSFEDSDDYSDYTDDDTDDYVSNDEVNTDDDDDNNLTDRDACDESMCDTNTIPTPSDLDKYPIKNGSNDYESNRKNKGDADDDPTAAAAAADDDDNNDNSTSTLGESVSNNNHSQNSLSTESIFFESNRTNRRCSSSMTVTSTIKTYRETQFEKILCMENNNNDDNNNNNNSKKNASSNIISNKVVKMTELRKISWNGIPPQYRGMSWKILLGYLPTNAMRRQQTLKRKRAEYKEAIRQHYYIDDNSRTIQEQETLRQVLVDVPRTAPNYPLFRNERIKRALSRVLYTWAIRHPASSYVQGINDLATPLFAVFLSDDYEGEDVLDGSVMVVLEEDRLEEVEADVYWCLTNILAGIQDHYTADQPGIQRMVMRLQELINRIETDLFNHIQSVGIQFMQFAFKWMNCLLLREFNLKCAIRLWDTYISEDGSKGFEDFHVYVCAAFLSQFSSQLQSMDFDELFLFMQEVPTEDWGEIEIEMLLSHAYVLSTLFGGSDAHLTSNTPLTPGM